MSDVSKTNELIAEARKFLFSDSRYGYEDTVEGDLICRLADALESATRVPVQGGGYTVEVDGQHFTQAQWEAVQRYCGGSQAVQGEPNDDREALMKAMERGEKVRQAAWSAYGQEPDGEGTKPYSDNWYRAEALMAAGFSRATVPDAATEAIGRGRLHDAVNALPNHVWDAVNEIADTEGFTDALLAALDGAPEPEWEYRWGDRNHHAFFDESRHEVFDSHIEAKVALNRESDRHEDRVLRRRKAGPWLPVEVESKP